MCDLMARQKGGARVLGPYPVGDGRYRVVIFTRESERRDEVCGSEAEAQRVRLAALAELAQPCENVDRAIYAYRQHLIDKGNKEKSWRETERRMRSFFASAIGRSLDMLTERMCRDIYNELRARVSPTTQLNMLAEAKSFLAWCDKQGWFTSGSPLRNVEPVGTRSERKDQLRTGESRAFLSVALGRGNEGGLAGACALILGLRSGEIVERVCRDVDDEGRILWVPHAKTKAGVRRVEVPELLALPLLELATAWPDGTSKGPADPLFGRRNRKGRVWRHGVSWVRFQARMLCKAAGVPYTPPHGLRGTHATLALAAGASGIVVAATLGHENEKITREAYAKPEATADASTRAVLQVLVGGKGRQR
jgi:integrase